MTKKRLDQLLKKDITFPFDENFASTIKQQVDHNIKVELNDMLHELDARLLSHVKENSIPCLGFCRGLQIMNVFNGGSLHPHLPDTLSNIHRGPDGATSHPIQVTKHINRLNLEIGSINDIVSHHHQGINELGANLDVWAVAPDGLYEGIRHSDTTTYPFYVGVQWHPERCTPGNEFDESIGKSFINAIISK